MAEKQTIKIVAAPMGEAPLWVREAWVGLELPLVGRRSHGTWRGVGILTGPKSALAGLWALLTGKTFHITGYRVAAREALELLDGHNPTAAAWWRDHTPHLLDTWGVLVFDDNACITSLNR